MSLLVTLFITSTYNVILELERSVLELAEAECVANTLTWAKLMKGLELAFKEVSHLIIILPWS
jgi:hypothetical protein